MICAAVVAVKTADLISSVISLSAVGLGLSLAFLILKAPNLAVTQLLVEILLVIVLVRATINRDLPLVKDGRWLFNTVSTLLFIGCFLFFAYFALKELPLFGEPLMRVSGDYITRGKEAGFVNIVSAISLNFRGYDTLVAAAVFFSALIGVLAITGKAGKSHEE